MKKPRPRRLARLLLSLSILALHACNRDEKSKLGSGSTAATASASRGTPLTDSNAEIAKYGFSASADSTIQFVAADSTRNYAGSIRAFRGTVLVAHGRSREASVSVEIDVASLQMNDTGLETLLKSASFLDVHSFPRARFVSTSVAPGGVQGATDTLKGTLELHGVTRPIEIPSTIHVGPSGVYLDAELRLSRTAFGLILPTNYQAAVNDEVVISLLIAAKREQ